MIRGFYAAAEGLLVQSNRADVISSNLAGVSVAGFRREIPYVSAFAHELEFASAQNAVGKPGNIGLLFPHSKVDLRPGALKHTGAQFDVALEGEGYFCVQASGGEAYTRGGAFRLNGNRILVTAAGAPVLGQTGAIRITGGKVEFNENGDLLVDGTRVDRLKLVEMSAEASVEKLGGDLLRAETEFVRPASNVHLKQGYLEAANVDAIGEMVGMISALRAFEASQRVLQANDQTLEKAINEIARV